MNGQITGSVRAGILTYHFSDNFGAMMQAYGLRTWLRRLGVEAEFVNYHPSHVENGGGFRVPTGRRAIRANAKILYLKAAAARRRLFGEKEQAAKIAAFQAEDLGITGPRFRTREEVDGFLAETRPDLLICGSDQIWAPSQQYGIDPVYYLSLPRARNTRRVSYAPSLGRASLDATYETEAARHLREFDGLSVREPSGAAIVSRLTGRADVACVPDPTILLGDYSDLAARGGDVGEGHVFCYALRTGQGIRQVAEAARDLTGARILSPDNPHRRWPEIGETVHPSPAEWVAHVSRARYVVSNSFHGTVFGILFRKPFVTVALPGARGALNERSLSLLTALGLEDRFVDGTDRERTRRVLEAPIDWSAAGTRLAAMQATGRGWLADQIARVAA